MVKFVFVFFFNIPRKKKKGRKKIKIPHICHVMLREKKTKPVKFFQARA